MEAIAHTHTHTHAHASTLRIDHPKTSVLLMQMLPTDAGSSSSMSTNLDSFAVVPPNPPPHQRQCFRLRGNQAAIKIGTSTT